MRLEATGLKTMMGTNINFNGKMIPAEDARLQILIIQRMYLDHGSTKELSKGRRIEVTLSDKEDKPRFKLFILDSESKKVLA